MDERAKLLVGSLVGAAAGVMVTYLYFTRDGRALRREIEPLVDDLVREVGRVQDAVQHLKDGPADAGGRTAGPWPRRSA